MVPRTTMQPRRRLRALSVPTLLAGIGPVLVCVSGTRPTRHHSMHLNVAMKLPTRTASQHHSPHTRLCAHNNTHTRRGTSGAAKRGRRGTEAATRGLPHAPIAYACVHAAPSNFSGTAQKLTCTTTPASPARQLVCGAGAAARGLCMDARWCATISRACGAGDVRAPGLRAATHRCGVQRLAAQ